MLPIIRFFLPTLLFGAGVVSAQTPPSHLPPVAPGYFNVSASTLINAPIDEVWQVLLDLPKYPEWNPFARLASVLHLNKLPKLTEYGRKQVVTNALFIPIDDQTPKEGGYMLITTQIPPIEGPIDANTPGNLLNTRISGEKITHINTPEPYQAAWKFHPSADIALSAERWSVLSVFEGQTYYETREVFDGLLAPLVESTQGDGLQKGFHAQAKALKARLESMT
uniref:Coenzyme Q-binding protein COQ10 START domain-containing protein n=1 Tax=Moniliophthora roreri TaxID=221103 RepID=A0A0W0EYQ0_MONRR